MTGTAVQDVALILQTQHCESALNAPKGKNRQPNRQDDTTFHSIISFLPLSWCYGWSAYLLRQPRRKNQREGCQQYIKTHS